MRIKLKANASGFYRSKAYQHGHFREEYYQMLKAVDGMILEVETEHLFKDQFNTPPIEGVTKLGLRIMHDIVDEVIDDERIYMMRCQYCGQCQDTLLKCANDECKGEDKYLEPLSKEAEISMDYMNRANEERKVGSTCEVNTSLPYVSIKFRDDDGEVISEYFFQGEEAEQQIAEYEAIDWLSCDMEDYFLAIAQNW